MITLTRFQAYFSVEVFFKRVGYKGNPFEETWDWLTFFGTFFSQSNPAVCLLPECCPRKRCSFPSRAEGWPWTKQSCQPRRPCYRATPAWTRRLVNELALKDLPVVRCIAILSLFIFHSALHCLALLGGYTSTEGPGAHWRHGRMEGIAGANAAIVSGCGGYSTTS